MTKQAIRWLARAVLSGLLIGSLVMSAINLTALARAPVGAAFVARGLAEIDTATELALARHATPTTIARRLDALLSEAPRNWLAINAVTALADDRAIPLPHDLTVRRDSAYAQDHNHWRTGEKCLSCLRDATTCPLSAILICRAPVDLTPLGDVFGLSRAALAYVAGRDVDRVDFILSAIGLSALALAPSTGGSSLSIKAGAGFAKLAKSMNRLPDALSRPLIRAFREGIDWSRMSGMRRTSDLDTLLRPDILRPATAILEDTGRMVRNTSVVDGLHLMQHIDTPADMARLARVSDTLGPRTVGVVEILGKSRALRLSMRLANEVWYAIAGLIGLITALIGLAGSGLGSLILRRLRRLTDRPANH
jgi:hypothetical protein